MQELKHLKKLKIYFTTGTLTAKSPQEWRNKENAIDLSVWIISNSKNPLIATNWNLDSDRGYAYKQWKGTILENEVKYETYVQ